MVKGAREQVSVAQRVSDEMGERIGGVVVGCLVLVELAFLNGREQLLDHRTESIIRID